MKEALNSLPVNVEHVYNGILSRIREKGVDEMQLAWRILSWGFHAARPLHMDELREALSVRPGDNDLDETVLLAANRITKVCESLLVYDKISKIVRFTHYSVLEFLEASCSQHLCSQITLARTCTWPSLSDSPKV